MITNETAFLVGCLFGGSLIALILILCILFPWESSKTDIEPDDWKNR